MTLISANLSGALLDYYVALADGRDARILAPLTRFQSDNSSNIKAVCFARVAEKINWYEPYSPSTDWSQGGPLIQKYRLQLDHWARGWSSFDMAGDTPLIAAMRALVSRCYGAEVPDLDPEP